MKLQSNQELYKEILLKTKSDVSECLNKRLNHHAEKLNSLKKLIISGEVNYKYALELNTILVKKLIEIRTNQLDEAPIKLRPLTEKESSELYLELSEHLEITPEESPSFFFSFFKEKLYKKFFNFNHQDLDPTCLISIKEMNSETPNFDNLIDNYIQNYTKILQGDTNLDWDLNSLKKYSEYVENMIYRQVGVNSFLAEKIYEAINLIAAVVIQKENSGLLSKDKKQIILKEIEYFLKELVDGNSRDITEVINGIKNRIIIKINETFERANKEFFPSIVKMRIEKMRQENSEITIKLVQTINNLEEEREELIGVLYTEQIDSFEHYLGEKIEAESIHSLQEMNDVYNETFKRSNSDLADFLEARNIYSVIIKTQLSDEEGGYFKILQEIKEIPSVLPQEKDNLLIYFYQSIELFASELKETVIGVLDYTFDEFIHSEFQTLGVEYEKRVAALDNVIKTNMLIFVNNFKEKLNILNAKDLFHDLNQTKKRNHFLSDEDLHEFVKELDQLVLTKINFDKSELEFFLTNKDILKNTLRYKQDPEHGRLTFNIMSAFFIGAIGVVTAGVGAITLAASVGIAGATPSIWEKFKRNNEFYESKYLLFLEQYINAIKSGFIIE